MSWRSIKIYFGVILPVCYCLFNIPKFRMQRIHCLNGVDKEIRVLGDYQNTSQNVLTMSFEELTHQIGGSGKAKMLWESLKLGLDPLAVDGIMLSDKAKRTVSDILRGGPLINAALSSEILSDCGTKKLLLQLEDFLQVESVLIPSYKYDRTTLCVSTQIGCDRGCAFCLTGKMGLVRNLTANEIISQVIIGIRISKRDKMPPLTNVVFMGMGDSGRNMAAVSDAVHALTDRFRLSMASSKIAVSSVGPSPEAFMTLAAMPASLAWSLHSADDKIRKKLVPSTQHSVVELRDGLTKALLTRPAVRTRTLMIAVTLIEGINDRLEDAQKLADFVRPMLEATPKIVLDLIPYNDISVEGFKRPSREAVNAFQQHLRSEGFFCSVRVTRGDAESAACGMLATSRKKQTVTSANNIVANSI